MTAQIERIRAILELLDGTCITEIEVREGAERIRLRRAPGAPSRPSDEDAQTEERSALPPTSPSPVIVESPVVGRFRARDPAVGEGDLVAAAEPLGTVESMRILTPVAASVAGVIASVYVEEGQPVEYGQPLFEVAPAEPAGA